MKKARDHGFSPQELRDLPKNTADPIAVFDNYKRDGSRSILTELHTKDGNFLVCVDVGKGQDIDFNIITSAFGKGNNSIVDWLNKGFAKYINKEKALDYLHYPAPIAETLSNRELDSAANEVKTLKKPPLPEEENAGNGKDLTKDNSKGAPGSLRSRVDELVSGLEERFGSTVEVVNSLDEESNAAAQRRIAGDERRGTRRGIA